MAEKSVDKSTHSARLPWVRILLLLILVTLQAQLWWGQGSLAELKQISSELERQKLLNNQLIVRNKQLEAQVELLRNSPDAIEGRARSELGLVRPNETLYRVVEQEKTDVKKAANKKGDENNS